jgi:hypothetical protein
MTPIVQPSLLDALGEAPTDLAGALPAPNCPHAATKRLPVPTRRIISASKRTDMPAFHLPKMVRWRQAGWVDVRNPYFRYENETGETLEQQAQRSTHVSLLPEHVIAIVWWSKNYAVYERLHHAFAIYPVQYFNFTINPRRADLTWLEPDVPPVEEALRQMDVLRRLHGGDMIAWRYDPLVFWTEAGQEQTSWDAEFFALMCREVARRDVRRVIVSVADSYLKFRQRLHLLYPERSLREPSAEEVGGITTTMREIASVFGVEVVGCAEPLVEAHGVARGACIDGALLRGKSGDKASTRLATDVHSKGRETCGCAFHTDLGNYEAHECGYACLYCYANPNHRRFIGGGDGR